MVSAPPGRSSTTTCWPSSGVSSAASNRATVSVALPAACGTTNLIGWSGYSAARLALAAQAKISAIRLRLHMMSSRQSLERGLFLTRGAIEGRASVLHDTLDLAFAVLTRLRLAVIDLKIVLKIAERAV